MNNPWSPSPEEIRDWAYTANAHEPCQDWDLALLWSSHEKAILDCASDRQCPSQIYMLGILYLYVGDAVRSDFRSRARPIIEGFIARGDAYPVPEIRLWQRRARELIRNPSTFNYDEWCGGGLAQSLEG